MLMDLTDEKETLGFTDEKPNWVKLDKGAELRVVFLTKQMTTQLTYTLHDKNAPKDSNTFRGSYKSLTAKYINNRDDIIKLIQTGDPEKKLKIDTQTLGEPNFLAATPVFVYPLDEDGEVDVEVLKAKGFKVQMLLVTPSRHGQIRQMVKRLAKKSISLLDVDVRIYTKKGQLAWEFEALQNEDSLFVAHKAKFEPIVKKRLESDYSRLGAENLEDFGTKFVGLNITESVWFAKLNEYGYIDNVSAVANTPPIPEEMKTSKENLFPEEEEDLSFE